MLIFLLSVELIMLKDIRDVCSFNKRSIKFKDIDRRKHILSEDKKVIKEKNIKSYLDGIHDDEYKKEFL